MQHPEEERPADERCQHADRQVRVRDQGARREVGHDLPELPRVTCERDVPRQVGAILVHPPQHRRRGRGALLVRGADDRSSAEDAEFTPSVYTDRNGVPTVKGLQAMFAATDARR